MRVLRTKDVTDTQLLARILAVTGMLSMVRRVTDSWKATVCYGI